MAAKLSILPLLISLILLPSLVKSSSSSSSDSTTNKDIPSITSHRSLLGAQRNIRQQISNCSQMVSRSQCFQNPTCRWCKSEALDDMCFSKSEAWRLPQQVFLCN
ncbi:hypothetical protein M5689_009024 [Euphorbia peplus]|nr:hypothetical protein M5689_009024 [Euphorbia peplus]